MKKGLKLFLNARGIGLRAQLLLVVLLLVALVLASCGGTEMGAGTERETAKDAGGVQEDTKGNEVAYMKITPEEAKGIMDGGAEGASEFVILDVRTQAEFDEGHIEGAVLLPNTDIKAQGESVLPDKDQLILVYCRSGNRSRTASLDLIEMGYTQVKDFGGIIDWPYEVVK